MFLLVSSSDLRGWYALTLAGWMSVNLRVLGMIVIEEDSFVPKFAFKSSPYNNIIIHYRSLCDT